MRRGFTLRDRTAAGTSSPYLASRSKMTNLGADPNGNERSFAPRHQSRACSRFSSTLPFTLPLYEPETRPPSRRGRLAVDSPIWLSVVLWTKAQLQSGIQSDRLHRPFGLTVGNLERVTRRAGAAHRGARSIGTVPPPAPWFEMHLRSAMAMLKLIPRRRIAERP